MVTWGSALVKHCQSIETVIAVEKRRLQTAKDQLKQYESNRFSDKEIEESRMQDDQIRCCKKQLQFLKMEYEKIRDEIANEEKLRIDGSEFLNKKKSLRVIAAEIESTQFEIGKLDKKLREIREVNRNMEKNREKKLTEIHANHGFIMKPRSSGCLQLGRLMMEQEDAKQALKVITDKKTRLQYIIRELEKNLTMVENECNRQEENIRMKESQELERNLEAIENAYKRRKEINNQLEFGLANARGKLELLDMTRKQMEINKTEELRMKIEEDKKLIEQYRENLTEMNLIASTLHDDLVEITRERNEYAENFMKNHKESMRKVNVEISKIKRENTDLDEKIEKITKGNEMENYEKNPYEKEENEGSNAERLLTRFRVEEREAKQKLQNLEESSKKMKEHIEYLLDYLFNAQIQCFKKERFLEDMSNGLWEVKKVHETVLRKKSSDEH